MSANYPPPQQPGPNQSPYAQPPASPYAQQQQPFGGQPGFNGAAYPPPSGPMATGRADNTALGVVIGVVAAIALALAYGGLLRALSKDDGSTSEYRLFAIAVGALIGLIVGKVGGRNPLLPVLCIAFALFAVIFGELFGGALIISHLISEQGGSMSVSDIFFHHFGDLWKAWKHDFDVKRAFFLICAGLVSFGLAKRISMS